MKITKLLVNPWDIGYLVKLVVQVINDEKDEYYVDGKENRVEFRQIPLSYAIGLIEKNQHNWLSWSIWGYVLSKNRNFELVAESVIKEI